MLCFYLQSALLDLAHLGNTAVRILLSFHQIRKQEVHVLCCCPGSGSVNSTNKQHLLIQLLNSF